MRLAEQWQELQAELPRPWESASLELGLSDPDAAARAGVLLGPAAPTRRDGSFQLHVTRESRPGATSAGLLERVLERLDREGLGGKLTLARAEEAREETTAGSAGPVAEQWADLVGALPQDWSHLIAQFDLDSSDYIERAALLIVQTNPRLAGGPYSLRFRCARRFGYGVSPGMAQRCFERCDREGITGRLKIVHVVSDAHPVATQGPVFRIAGGSV